MAEQPLHVELLVDGAWSAITGDVRADEDKEITRGRREEGTRADPATCNFKLNNRHGRYSPRNPASDLYGKIGRNTPLRLRLGPNDGRLVMPEDPDEESVAWLPDSAALDIVGDLDLRLELDPETWRPASVVGLARKYLVTGNQRSWAVWLNPSGTLNFRYSQDGVATTTAGLGVDPVPEGSGRLAIRVTFDADDGAGNHWTQFYSGPGLEGPWTPLGAPAGGPGIVALFASTARLEVGRIDGVGQSGVGSQAFTGELYAFELRNGIDGPVVAAADWRPGEPAAGWTVEGLAVLVDESVRFAGEVVAWPPRWDLSDSDVWVNLEAAGILRRLGQGEKALRSALRTEWSRLPNAVGYWPAEDPEGATQFANALAGGPAATFSGPVDLAAYGDFDGSDALPTFGAGSAWQARPPAFTPNPAQFFWHAVHVPTNGVGGAGALQQLIGITTRPGSILLWRVSIQSNGDLTMSAFDQAGALVAEQGAAFAVNGWDCLILLGLNQVGANIDWVLYVLKIGEGGGASEIRGTINGHTYGAIFHVDGPLAVTDLNGAALGHFLVNNGNLGISLTAQALTGWPGETAGARLVRLCAQEGVPLRVIGHPAATEPLGMQEVATLLEVLSSAAEVDLGFLGEQRQALGLLYRTRRTLYSQEPALVLNYADGEVFAPILPTDDDQHVRNEVEVKRARGSSTIARLEEGPLSVQSPPDGVGIYDTSVTLSLHRDADLANQAAWRLHLGTVDEQRVAALRVNLANPRMAQHLAAVGRITEGDRIQITNTPAWLPPGGLDLLVQGWRETIGPYLRDIVFNCTPARPWTVPVIEEESGRLDTAGSQLAAAVDDEETVLSVATTSGPVWTQAAADIPFEVIVDGERMAVTAVVGAASPQTFTVTRGLDGIVKAHAAGAVVELANPAHLGL